MLARHIEKVQMFQKSILPGKRAALAIAQKADCAQLLFSSSD